MHIRLYRPVDSDAVMALATRLAIGVAPRRNTSAVANAVQSWVRESLADHSNDQRPVFVAEEAGHVVGFAVAGTGRARSMLTSANWSWPQIARRAASVAHS